MGTNFILKGNTRPLSNNPRTVHRTVGHYNRRVCCETNWNRTFPTKCIIYDGCECLYIYVSGRCIFSLFTLVFNLKSNLLKQLNCFASSEMRHFFFRYKFHWFGLKKSQRSFKRCFVAHIHSHIPKFVHVFGCQVNFCLENILKKKIS